MRKLAILTLCLIPAAARAQQRPNWNGAFTAAQAGSGQQLYRDECLRCHGATLGGGESAPELSGAAFLARWTGRTAADLLDRTRRTMPTDNPGGLERVEIRGRNGLPPERQRLHGGHSRNRGWVRPRRREIGGVALLRRRCREHQVFSPRPDQRRQREELEVAWRWTAENFGRPPEFNWEVTPLMVGGVLYFTAGTRRDVVAVDAATGETLWMYRLDEGERGSDASPAANNRGLAYWTRRQRRRPHPRHLAGYQLVALECQNRPALPSFGKQRPASISSTVSTAPASSPAPSAPVRRAIVVKDVVVVGAAAASRHRAAVARQHPRLRPRLRRPHRQALDLPHHPAARRIRQRNLGKRFLEVHRQHRRLGPAQRR